MRKPEYATNTHEAIADEYAPPTQAPLLTPQPHAVARSFTQSFGLHPAMALLTVIVDVMLFGSDLATAGFIIPLTIAVAFGLGLVVFLAQRKWYGDDIEAAFIKAFIVAGLTAIPTSLPGFLTVPAGLVGLFHRGER